ncbi:S1C family serine protease [Chloroflexota bacterium]
MISISEKRVRYTFKWLVVLIVVILISVLTGCVSTVEVDDSDNNGTPPVISPVLYDENRVIALYEQSIPAVVMIIVEIESGEGGQGSGFIIDEQGHIITNNHVVEGATNVTVILHSEIRLEATVIGTDRESDVALLQVDTEKLGKVKPLPLGDSDSIKPGQMAIALGSPFGLDGSITIGIISGVGRLLNSGGQRINPEIIQTDAAINPGNSGGPLINSSGGVIGINTAIEIESTGIGFAVPINTIKSLLPALLRGGEVKNPWLGITAIAINPEIAELLELSISRGVYVITVAEQSPAEESGLIGSGSDNLGQPVLGGDIITAVDRIEVLSVEGLIAYFNDMEPGDKISLSVLRGNEDLIVEVILGEWPDELQ